MKKALFLVAFTVLLFSSAFAQELIIHDTFSRSDIAPWQDACCYRTDGTKSCGDGSNWCYGTRIVGISGGKAFLSTEARNLSSMHYTIYTRIPNFNWYMEIESSNNNDLVGLFWWSEQQSPYTIVLNRHSNTIQVYYYDDLISKFLLEDYPFTYNYQIPYNFGSGYRYWQINITKSGNTTKLYINGVKVLERNCTTAAQKIGIEVFNPLSDTTVYVDNIIFYSTTPTKLIPIVNITATSYVITYGTPVTISCYAIPSTLRVNIYYLNQRVSNPYTAILPVGNHYFYCESEETEEYWSGSDSLVVQVLGQPPTTTTLPQVTPIENISKPIPQLVNETEWREAGFGWALFFFSPIGLITFMSLVVSAVISRVGGWVFGVVSFLFMWFILVYFTGILPDWLFITLVVVAGFIVASVVRQFVMGK
ncbi:MAG: hypothetical protein QW734_07050 [Candidatus Bathyarchaeia archaeon]